MGQTKCRHILATSTFCCSLAFDLVSPHGKIIASVMTSLAEFERDLIRERIKSGLEAARTRGKRRGRQPRQRPKADRLPPKVLELVAAGHSYQEVSREVRLSKSTVACIVKRSKEQSGRGGLVRSLGYVKFRFVFSPRQGVRPCSGDGHLALGQGPVQVKHDDGMVVHDSCCSRRAEHWCVALPEDVLRFGQGRLRRAREKSAVAARLPNGSERERRVAYGLTRDQAWPGRGARQQRGSSEPSLSMMIRTIIMDKDA